MSVNKVVVCDACQQGKSHQLPFSLSTRVTTSPLEIIYSDVWGPAQTSVSGHQFYSARRPAGRPTAPRAAPRASGRLNTVAKLDHLTRILLPNRCE